MALSRKAVDITGQRFGRLTALYRVDAGGRNSLWHCVCECGNERDAKLTDLRNGTATQCVPCSFAGKVTCEDLTGRTFGSLTVTSAETTYRGSTKCICNCACGKTIEVYASRLLRGDMKSCGCMNPAAAAAHKPRNRNNGHKTKNERLYQVWGGIKQRCYNPKRIGYEYYGGRGIKVCDEWLQSYEAFRDWAYSSGYDENAARGQCTIDRIDVDGNYCPENCRWISMAEQNKNKRN